MIDRSTICINQRKVRTTKASPVGVLYEEYVYMIVFLHASVNNIRRLSLDTRQMIKK